MSRTKENPDGYYYLHQNGDLIYKKFKPDQSDFVVEIWSLNTENRANAWKIVLEAAGLGADKERLKELVENWQLTVEDSVEFLKRHPAPDSEEMKKGLSVLIEQIWDLQQEEYLDILEEKLKDGS